jgi:epoxide hydrolase-like predicted phosphatase
MAIKAVIFDLGGVVLRTTSPEVRSRLEDDLHLPTGTLDERIWGGPDWKLAEVGGISYEEYWGRVGASLGLSTPEEIAAFRHEYFSGDHLDQELVDLIRGLRARYKTGLLSNAPDKLGYWLHNRWNIERFFDAVVYSAEVGIAKPDPRIYHLILRRLKVKPSQSVFIDDTPDNVEAAIALGMKAIRFTSTRTLKDELRLYVTWDSGEPVA